MRRSAFTLVELLIVLTVIMILAGLIVSVCGMVSKSSLVTRTKHILATLRSGIELARNDGKTFAIVPHPLWDDGSNFAIDSGVVSEPSYPNLDGMPKDHCGVLGASIMSSGSVFAGNSGNPADPYTFNAKLFASMFGSGGTLDELSSLGAVFTPPNDTTTVAACGNRLWMDSSDFHYRLRGMYFYDAWGSEILAYYKNSAHTEIGLLSPGPDGIFGSAGADGVYGTADDATTVQDNIDQ